jgi:hypothetical protein
MTFAVPIATGLSSFTPMLVETQQCSPRRGNFRANWRALVGYIFAFLFFLALLDPSDYHYWSSTGGVVELAGALLFYASMATLLLIRHWGTPRGTWFPHPSWTSTRHR